MAISMNTLILIVLAAVIIIVIIAVIVKKRSSRYDQNIDADSTQVYVGNLSYSLKDYQLKNEFEKYGEITAVRIIKHPQSRRSKGFGFITFESPKAVKKAVKMHGKELNGRTLVVRVANARD